MNNRRLLLFAVFCIFQPISTEHLFNGRERCSQQRPDISRKDSRLLEHQSNARTDIRRVDNRSDREFSERVNAEYVLRFSERNSRDENIRAEDRRPRSNDRIRVSLSRQRIAENVDEDRSGRRSSRNERSELELRNVREERLLNAENERETRNIRLIRSLSEERSKLELRNVREERRLNAENERAIRNIRLTRSLTEERSKPEPRNVREERRLNAENEREIRNIRLTRSLLEERSKPELRNVREERRLNAENERETRNIRLIRSLSEERSKPELRNVREERRLNTENERETRNIRLTRSLSEERSKPELRNVREERRLNAENERAIRNIRLTRSLTEERSKPEPRNVREERRLNAENEREIRNIRLTRSLLEERSKPELRNVREERRLNAENERETRNIRLIRSLSEERSKPELRNVREERRLNTENERETRNIRLTRSLSQERSKPELRNVREERRLNAENEREIRNIRLTRSLSEEIRRNNKREDTRARKTLSRESQFPNRGIVERNFDDIQDRLISSRQGRYLNERRDSRSTVHEDARANSEVVYARLLRTDDPSRRNNERLEREFQGNVMHHDKRPESVIRATFNNEIRTQMTPAASRRVTEQRGSVQRREFDESRTLQRELRESPNEARERIVKLHDSRRLLSERLTQPQRNVHVTRRNNIRMELTRTDNEEINRQRFTITDNRAFEQRELTQRREIKSRQTLREFGAYSNQGHERESMQRRGSQESRGELREIADKAKERYLTSDDSIRRANERVHAKDQRNIRQEYMRTYNSEVNRRNSPVTTNYDTEQGREAGERQNSRRETRNSGKADSHNLRNIVRQNARHNYRMDISRNYLAETSRRSSPASTRDVDDRVEYLHRRHSDTSRDFRRETKAQQTGGGYVVRASSDSRISPNSVRNMSDRRESVERIDDTRRSRRESRSEFSIRLVRFDDLAQRINEGLQSQNRRVRQNTRSQSVPTSDVEARRSFEVLTQDTFETRESRQRDNIVESRNFRREVRLAKFGDSRRDNERFDTRVQRQLRQSGRTRDSNIRALNMGIRQDNRRDDENRRTAGLNNRVAKVVRDENEASRIIRDKDMTTELSLRRTVSMPIRRQLEKRSQRDTSARRTRINDSNVPRETFDQMIRAVSLNREHEINVARRVKETQQSYRFERRYLKNTFERNMERDTDKRLLDDSTGNRRDSRRNAIFSRDSRISAKNEGDIKTLREEIRLSMAPLAVSSEEASDLSFKWQYLLYLLQAAYIVGLLAKLSQSRGHFEKKTRIGIWNYSPKLIKVD